MFEKVLVANRGEIAVRVMRACEELGVDTVAVYSDADKHGGHVRYADEAYNVGPARAADSYLDGEAILDAARSAGADAIHPGYGFLAENATFAARVEAAEDITWVGPTSDAMERLGEKTAARRVMADADVPIVPGTTEPVTEPEAVTDFGDEHGYPVAIKAEGGGGGRGMKVVESADEVEDQLAAAKREGEAYFSNDSVYLERYLETPRHVEIQIVADEAGTVVHLGERDCSLQRRHQKVIEEAPSPSLSEDLRTRIGDAAVRGISTAEYTNAGTVEFLVWEDSFYFMEVNTRIQVEHPATEMVTGLDIVKWQLRIAAGEELDFAQEDVEFDGHAIEYRINAENPAEHFEPSTGRLETYHRPGGIGVRLDDAVREGDEIGGEYDPLIAKLIVHAGDREECLRRSERALREFEISGLHTTIPFHRLMLLDQRFNDGTHTTPYLDEELDVSRLEAAVERWGPAVPEEREDAESVVERTFTVEVDGKRFDVELEERGVTAAQPAQQSSEQSPQREPSSHAGTAGEEVVAEMQGTVLEVVVSAGDEVDAGDVLCVIEAMKMENDVVASADGTVTDVPIAKGESVDMGDILCVIE